MFGEAHGDRIDNMIKNVIEHADRTGEISMDDEHQEQLMVLRRFMFEHVYDSEAVKKEEELQKSSTGVTQNPDVENAGNAAAERNNANVIGITNDSIEDMISNE